MSVGVRVCERVYVCVMALVMSHRMIWTVMHQVADEAG